MARNRLAKKIVKEAEGTVTVEFTDGSTVTVEVGDLPEGIVRRAALHGVSQKVGDAFAGADTVEEAFEAARAVADNLVAGTWASRGAVGGAVTILVEALYEATKHEGRSMEDCEELVADMSDEQKKGLKQVPQIKAHMDRIAAERAAKRAEDSAKKAGDAPMDLSQILGS